MNRVCIFLMCLITGVRGSGVLHTVNLSGVAGGPTEEELTTMIDHFKEKLENIQKQEIQLEIIQPYEGKGFVAINGLREEPIYLYQREIKKIFKMKDKLDSFVKDNQMYLA